MDKIWEMCKKISSIYTKKILIINVIGNLKKMCLKI